MTKIIDRAGSGAAITANENDDNLDSLSGVNVPYSGTSVTITVAYQNDIVEFTNAGSVAVTLDSLATIVAATHTSDFTVTLLNTGAGTVTITPDGANSINTGAATIVLATDEYVTIQNDNTNLIWNIINSNVDVATKTGTETLTNKTLSGGSLTTHASSPFATTSGSSVTAGSIPSWVKRITVSLNGVSTSSTGSVYLRIGDAGGLHTSSYVTNVTVFDNGVVPVIYTGTGSFTLKPSGLATDTLTGHVFLTRADASNHDWVISGMLHVSSTIATIVTGSTTLDTALTQLALITANTFDAGEFGVDYEG